MSRKAIFGGTFDPVHNGHIYLANRALEVLNLAKVIFVPAGNPPLKAKKNVTDGKVRLQMIEKAIEDNEKFQVDAFEVNNKNVSYTYKTLEHFKALEKNTEWYFLVGTDCLYEFHLWKNVDIILDLCQVVVFNRPGYNHKEIFQKKNEIEKKYSKEILFLDVMDMDIASSSIRDKIKSKENVDALLPKPVKDIINKYELYR